MKRRNPVACLLLSLFVPFYPYYWCYITGKELERRGTEDFPSILPLFLFTLVYIVGFVYTMASSFSSGQTDANPPAFLFGLVTLVPVIWILAVVYFYAFSKRINRVVQIGMGDGLLTLIFVLLQAVPIYLIQEKLNQSVGIDQSPQPPVSPV